MTFFDETKTIVENLYLLSGPMIFLIALLGLRQLKIAKDSIKINSQRQSATMAFELCEKYFVALSKIYNQIGSEMLSLKIDFKKIEKLNLDKLDDINKENENYSEYQKVLDNYDKFRYKLGALSDMLETFSIPFIKKIADEELAYNMHFLKFHQYCNLCSVHIIEIRMTHPDEKVIYENVIKLYSIWKNRYEKERIESQVISLLTKRNSIQTKKIKPIGT